MTAKTTKVRSPNYPAISLRDAIAKIKLIYDKEHRNPTDKAVIAQHLGYNGLNGASITLISALVKYSLLEDIGQKQVKLSETALDILWRDQGDPERAKLLREAALTPSLFSDLSNAFPDELPSDQTLRYHLLKKEFNPKVVDSVMRAYRDTLEFVNAEEALRLSVSHGYEEPLEEPMQTQPSRDSNPSYRVDAIGMHAHVNPSGPASSNGMPLPTEQGLRRKAFAYPLTENCAAHVEFDGEVTLEAVETLIDSLEVYKKVLSRKKESQKNLTEIRLDNLPPQVELLQQEEFSDTNLSQG